MEEKPIVKQASQAFEAGQYQLALDLYRRAADMLGSAFFDVNIALCKRRMGSSDAAPSVDDTPVAFSQQLHNTQQLLEYYFIRSQELENQLLDR